MAYTPRLTAPLDALIATLEIQQQLSTAETADGLPLPLRCGLHAGIDERRDGDFYGRAVNRAARIMSAAHGGQMLLSQAVAEQVDGILPNGASLRDLGVVRLRDLSTPEHIFQLLHPRLRADFPALRSLEGTPEQPDATAELVHRPRTRTCRNQANARVKSVGDAARYGRHR